MEIVECEHMDQHAAKPPPCQVPQTWQVNSARRSHGEMDRKREGESETAKQVDSLCCDLCDEWQRSEARAQERVSILGHLQRRQPVFHGAHAAQVRSAAVQQGVMGRTADGGERNSSFYAVQTGRTWSFDLHSRRDDVVGARFKRSGVADHFVQHADDIGELGPCVPVLLPAVQHQLVQHYRTVHGSREPEVLLDGINHLQHRRHRRPFI